MVIVSNLLLVAFASYVLVYYPYTRFGPIGFGVEIAVTVLVFLILKIKDARDNQPSEEMVTYGAPVAELSTDTESETELVKGPSFRTVTWETFLAWKDKYCYPIEIDELKSKEDMS